MGSNVHELIANRLRQQQRGASGTELQNLQKALNFEESAMHQPSNGVWTLTRFGTHIDSRLDVAKRLPKQRDGARWQDRQALEKRGTELLDTKIPIVLTALRMHGGGASTGELLENIWSTTTTYDIYGAMNNLTAQPSSPGGKKKVSSRNETLRYFKELLRWPTLEPAVEFVKYQPGPIAFQRYYGRFGTLGDIVKAAMRRGFKVDFGTRGESHTPYYAIALPETIGELETLQYIPENAAHAHFMRLEMPVSSGLQATLVLGDREVAVDVAAAKGRVDDYGRRWWTQRCTEATAYRQRIKVE